MGASVSSALNREPGTGLTKTDAERLKRRFHKLAQGADVLSVRQFELIPELAGNPFLPRLFAMFDTDKDGRLTQAEFNNAVDYFLRAQTAEERMQLAFRMYDLDGTGFVTEAALLEVLEKGAGSNFSPQQLQAIARSTVQEYDKDGDGKLSFTEFQRLASQNDFDATVLP